MENFVPQFVPIVDQPRLDLRVADFMAPDFEAPLTLAESPGRQPGMEFAGHPPSLETFGAHLERKRASPELVLRLVALDVLALVTCFGISAELRHSGLLLGSLTYAGTFLVVLTCLIGLAVAGGYENGRNMAALRYFSEHVLAMGVVMAVAFILTYSFSSYNELTKPARSVLFLTLLLFTPWSLAYRYSLSRKTAHRAAIRYVDVIGRDLFGRLNSLCQEVCFRHPLRLFEPNDGAPLEAEPREAIVVDLAGAELDPAWRDFLLKTNVHAAPVYPIEVFIETYFHKISLRHVHLAWALDGTFNPERHSAYGNVKKLLDLMLASILLALLLPVMLVIALLIKLDDVGPVLFAQRRIGRFERPFVLYKFRTMGVAAPDNFNLYTSPQDPRITRIGGFLRCTRLDELPQLWNVLTGQMSLIGPRAEWDRLVTRYEREIPYYHLRHTVKPGITGWAQVNYTYGANLNDARAKLEYDLYYIKHFSPRMDASIILKTIFTMFSGAGR